MANIEKKIKNIVKIGSAMWKCYLNSASAVYKKLKSLKVSIFDESSELVKRSISGSLIVFLYFTVITIGGGLYSFAILVAALIAFYETVILITHNSKSVMFKAHLKNGLVVILITFSSLLLIRFTPQGERVTLWLFLVVISLDTAAYAIGKSFGKKAILPNISPNKTLEGAIGGSIVALIISMITYTILSGYNNSFFKFSYFIIASILLIIGAQIGDILQSIVKRHFKVKDMGNVIPGHGGVMDRMDSFVVAAPLTLLLITIVNGRLF
ncbi:MAG: CDP-archaeol synthase [Alphaproteobacteria bacterium]|nr:CDP-archaeol synthase [Rickettsiales bacterium]